MSLSPLFDQALTYAADVHRSQVRKDTTIPYVAHLLSVCGRVLSHGGTEVQAIAALLHDAAEDQGGRTRLDDIRARFGEEVAAIVADCTDAWTEPKPLWRRRKEAYLALLPTKPSTSLLVSLADKVDNAEAILGDYRVIGDDLWSRFTGDVRGRSGTTALSTRYSSGRFQGRSRMTLRVPSINSPIQQPEDDGRSDHRCHSRRPFPCAGVPRSGSRVSEVII